MTIEYKTRFFPNFPISKQLFRVPGAGIEGGFTSGGARISTPDIGGFGSLRIQPSYQVGEWEYPSSSWLMSNVNRIYRVRLARTPQVVRPAVGGDAVPWDGGILWSNQQMWEGDITGQYLSEALEGTTTLTIDMSTYGQILQDGHCIGHVFDCYMIDEIIYDNANVATITVLPPLRRTVNAGDTVLFRPWFTGMIEIGQDFTKTYDASDVGNIQLNMIYMSEVIL